METVTFTPEHIAGALIDGRTQRNIGMRGSYGLLEELEAEVIPAIERTREKSVIVHPDSTTDFWQAETIDGVWHLDIYHAVGVLDELQEDPTAVRMREYGFTEEDFLNAEAILFERANGSKLP